MDGTGAVGVVRSVDRYPVKSMLGETLPECAVDDAGLLGDRAYALVDAADGTVASAKHPRKWRELLRFGAAFVDEPRPGEPPPPVRITFPDGSVRHSDDAGIDDDLSAAVGRPVRLVAERPEGSSFEEVWPDIEGLAPQRFIDDTAIGRTDSGEVLSRISLGALAPTTTFFDLAVLHVLTTATLTHLAELAPGATFDARRYRPNLLLDVEGSGFTEDAWVGRGLRVGDALETAVTMATMRCVMTTLPQAELPPDGATLRAIAAHHRLRIDGFGTWACAGVYADVTAPGTVRAGDTVHLGG